MCLSKILFMTSFDDNAWLDLDMLAKFRSSGRMLWLADMMSINLRSFLPPLAFRCRWRKRTSIALEKTAERQRTATPFSSSASEVSLQSLSVPSA